MGQTRPGHASLEPNVCISRNNNVNLFYRPPRSYHHTPPLHSHALHAAKNWSTTTSIMSDGLKLQCVKEWLLLLPAISLISLKLFLLLFLSPSSTTELNGAHNYYTSTYLDTCQQFSCCIGGTCDGDTGLGCCLRN